MSDERRIELTEQTERGRRCEIALEELDAAMKELRARCMDTFIESSVHDSEGHQACKMYLNVLDDVEDRFKHAVYLGETARRELISLAGETPSPT